MLPVPPVGYSLPPLTFVPEPGEEGGAKAVLPGPIHATPVRVSVSDVGLDGQRNSGNLISSAFAFSGSLQSAANTYSGYTLFCSTYGNSGTSPLHRPCVPCMAPGVWVAPGEYGMYGG